MGVAIDISGLELLQLVKFTVLQQQLQQQLTHTFPAGNIFTLQTITSVAVAGVAEWLTRQPRDLTKKRAKPKRQDSWWASCSQGFESLPRRQSNRKLIG